MNEWNNQLIRQRCQAMRETLQSAIQKHNTESKSKTFTVEIGEEKKAYLEFKKKHWKCDCMKHIPLENNELKRDRKSIQKAQEMLVLARKMRENEFKRLEEKEEEL